MVELKYSDSEYEELKNSIRSHALLSQQVISQLDDEQAEQFLRSLAKLSLGFGVILLESDTLDQ